jgi:threonine/homoserine/homoserine lactone efflux protein
MDLNHWILFSSIILLASISPGPNVVAVIVQALESGFKGAAYTILGNLIALFTIALAAAVGVGTLLQAAPDVFSVMKLAGGAYLAWMGIKMLNNSFKKIPSIDLNSGLHSARKQVNSRRSLIVKAMLISYSNPKSILFLSAVFPAFLVQGEPVPLQFTVMFMTIITMVVFIHGSYGLLALRMKDRLVSVKARKLMSRLSGISFLGFGCGFMYDAQK